MQPVQHAIAGGQGDGHAQGVAEQQRGRRQLQADAFHGVPPAARRAVQQAGVLLLGQRVGVVGAGQLALQGGEVAGQRAQGTQQVAPGRVVLGAQVLQRVLQVGHRLGAVGAMDERLAQLDRLAEVAAGARLQGQQALAAVQHVAVEERLGQRVVGGVRGAGAFVDVLGHEVQLQVAAHLRSRPRVADAVQEDLLGGVERRDQLAVLPRQGQAPRLDVEAAQRLEQRRLELQVQAQLAVHPRQAVLHRLVGEQRVPQHREQAVPGRAADQQQRFAPEVLQLAVALVDADHAVDRQDQGRRGDRRVALAERAEHHQGEGGEDHAGDEQPGVGEQQFDGEGRHGKAQQGHQQRVETAQPAVVGLRQGAGDDAEEQRDDQPRLALPPTERHGPGQGDEHPQAVAELVLRPQAAQGLAEGVGTHGPALAGSDAAIIACA
ncbi:hypothetical protein D9M68_367050 [compost metagenome]